MDYIKKIWVTGEKAMAADLNHLEDGVEAAAEAVSALTEESAELKSDLSNLSGLPKTIRLNVTRETIDSLGVISEKTTSLLTDDILPYINVGDQIASNDGYQFRFVRYMDDGSLSISGWLSMYVISDYYISGVSKILIHVVADDRHELYVNDFLGCFSSLPEGVNKLDCVSSEELDEVKTVVNDCVTKIDKLLMPFVNDNEYSGIASRFRCTNPSVKISDANNSLRIHTNSSESTEATILIIGEPSDHIQLKFAVDSSDFEYAGELGLNIILKDGTEISLGRKSTSNFWKVDGATVVNKVGNHPLSALTQAILSSDGNTTTIGFVSDEQTLSYSSGIKSLYFTTAINSDADMFITGFEISGYDISRTTAGLFMYYTPYDFYENMVVFAYYAPEDGNKITIESVDLLTQEKQSVVLDNAMADDTHNIIDLMVDNNGDLHLMGNCHCTKLWYYFGSVSDLGSVAESTKLSSGESEGYATYPQFFRFNGNVYATYREMTSTAGRWKVYLYDHVSKTFSPTTSEYIADGTQGTQSCPYFQRWVVDDESGWAYNAWCWRQTDNVISCYDLMFIKTNDFKTFYNYKNEAIMLPITVDNYINQCRVLEIPQESGLINQHFIKAFAFNGKPYIWYMQYDGNGIENIYLVLLEDAVTVKKLTNFDYDWKLKSTALQSRVIDVDVAQCGIYQAINIRHRYCGDTTILVDPSGNVYQRNSIIAKYEKEKLGMLRKYIRNEGALLMTDYSNSAAMNNCDRGTIRFC